MVPCLCFELTDNLSNFALLTVLHPNPLAESPAEGRVGLGQVHARAGVDVPAGCPLVLVPPEDAAPLCLSQVSVGEGQGLLYFLPAGSRLSDSCNCEVLFLSVPASFLVGGKVSCPRNLRLPL